MTMRAVKSALKRKYDRKQFVLLWEVWNCRRVDAIAVRVNGKRSVEIIGHEIKVSRRDWRKEIHNPAKAACSQHCDYWYVVESKLGIVRDDELPEPFGLMLLTSAGSVRVIRSASRLTPKPLDRQFMAALLRSTRTVR